MNKSTFSADDFAVLRFPVLDAGALLALGDADEARLEALARAHLADPYVREAIYLASPALFRNLQAWEAGDGEFNGMPQAIARYLLRMAFRATPFGTFSALAPCRVAGRETRIRLPARPLLRRFAQLDCSALSRLAQRCVADAETSAALRYVVNDTMFADGDALVFTAFDRNKRGRRVYRRVEIERDPYLDVALAAAEGGNTVGGIADALLRAFPDEVEAASGEAEAFVLQLVSSQVLCSDSLVDITDADPLGALLAQLPQDAASHRAISEVSSAFDALPEVGPHEPPGAYALLSERLAAFQVRADRGLPTKVDLYAPDDATQVLSRDVVAELECAVTRLTTLTRKKGKLADFKKVFVERYGDAEVPLGIVGDQLEALGFSDRDASLPALSRMVRGAHIRTGSSGASLVDRVLSLALARSDERYVDITQLVDDGPPVPPIPGGAPASLVAWFALWSQEEGEGAPVVELRSVGAQAPGRLMGRFAHGLPSVADYLRQDARRATLPVVEIVHQPEDRLGNISARPRLSDYEIRIRGGEPREARRLPLDDLTVSVSRDRVVIRSRSLGGPVELRMSNAHAYDRQGNLPLYRFLNQVSGQDYSADLLSLRRRMPNAAFLPGLKYRNMIVSRPAWSIGATELMPLRKLPRAEQRDAFRALCRERDMPDWIALAQGDHVIPCRLSNDWMLDGLLKQGFKTGDLTVSDVFPEDRRPHLRSDAGAHFHEMQIALRSQARAPSVPASATNAASHREVMMPLWSEWAYFKLHVPPHQQNMLLSQLAPSLERMMAAGDIDGHFFVRYRDEQGAHLRLRLHAGDGRAMERALAGLRPAFDAASRDRLLHAVSAAPYVREATRYGGPARMTLCERIFCVDSALVLDALPSIDADAIACWRDVACAVDAMLLSFGLHEVKARLAFARRAAADFAVEQQFSTEERKRIGEIYAGSPPVPIAEGGVPERPGLRAAPIFDAGIGSIRTLWDALMAVPEPITAEGLYGVQWSLIHMRLNRIFDRDARLQEAIVWELVKRTYAAHVSRAAQAVEA
ncbi:MAG TPA: lantibiotic dehydratase [Xanthomonadaceae bacterium]